MAKKRINGEGIVWYVASEKRYRAQYPAGGNSGGPLLDNEGRVVGTVTVSAVDSDFNIATSLDGLCKNFIECDAPSYWPLDS